MPYKISIDSRASISKQFEPEIDGQLFAFITLGPVSAEQRAQIPRTMFVGKRSNNTVPAILGWNTGPFIVCSRLRDVLEELEPGRHDFVPITIKSRVSIAGTTEHGTYYLILPPPRLDAIVIEKTTFAKGEGRPGFEASFGRIPIDPEASCVLDADVIAGHHFWQLPRDYGQSSRDPSVSQWSAYFCSDELWRWIKAEKLDGWLAERPCTSA